MKKTLSKLEKEQNTRRRRHVRLLILLALLVIITVCAIIYTSVTLFSKATRENRTETITKTAKLAAGIIDGDKIDSWLADGPDDAYVDTAERLQNILYNTPQLQYLYVYRIDPEGCHVIFDFDPPEETRVNDELPEISASALGEVVEFDESFADYLPTLFEGGRIDVIESNDTYGWLITAYEPVYASDGRCAAYVGADISMANIRNYISSFRVWITLIAAVFLIGIIIIGILLSANTLRADEREEFLKRQQRDKQLLRELVEAFARVIDMKDAYTQGHSTRVAKYTEMLSRELGYDEETIEKYYNIALMHDIGKIGIPDVVLNKPGKLSDEEFSLIKSHTVKGYSALKTTSLMPEIAVGAESHHERPDGKGYPQGLTGDKIPRVAQIIAVADCFDAMYSNRPYRGRMNFEKVVSIIKEASGTQLTPDVVDAFLRLVEKGEFRAPDDHGGGSTENIENIHKSQNEQKNSEESPSDGADEPKKQE